MKNEPIIAMPKTHRGLTTLTVLSAVGIFMLDLRIPLGVAGGVLYIIVVLLSRWLPRCRDTWIAAGGVSVLTILGLIFSPQAGGIMWMVLFNRFLALLAIWVTAFFCAQFKCVEGDVREGEARLRQVIDLMPHMVFATNRQGRFLLVNRALADTFNTTVEELTGKRLMDVHFDRSDVQAVLGDGQPVTPSGLPEMIAEESYRDEQGRRRWVQMSKVPYFTTDTAEPATLGLAVDVTALKKVEQRLRESEANLSSLVENTQDLIWSLDRHSRLLTFNTAFARIVKQVMGIDLYAGMPLDIPDFQQRRAWWDSRYRRALRGEQFTEEYPAMLSLPGRDFEVSFNPILGQGEVLGASCFMRDITPRKRAEEQLHVSEHKYRTLFQGAADAIFTERITEDGPRILDCNLAALKMFGFTREAIVGKSPAELSPPVQPDGRFAAEKISHIVKAALAGKPQFLEWVHRRADGTSFDAEVSVNRLELGAATHLQATVRDVTQRKRAEAEREELITILEAQNAELERFAYTISHDLKSPLITIKGYLGLLEQDVANGNAEEVKNDFARIAGAADKMSELLRNVLDLSRIGRLINEPEDVALTELANEALELVSPQIANGNVRIDVAPDLPVFRGDRVRLREVLQNLIENAVKYTSGQPTPRIEIGSRRLKDETICFVRDNGIGVEPCYHQRIFGLFDQLDQNVEGSGVGLALSKRIIDVHGGRIWVESDGLGCGSTFCFSVSPPADPEASVVVKPG